MYLLLIYLLSFSTQAEEIKVISERSIKNISDTVSDITVFDEQAIRDSGAGSVKDFLEQESDIHIFSPGVGQPESVQIRGNDARHTLILIDGQSIADITGTDGSARLESVSLQNITKIEIIKGSESVLYGSQAIGGVINIITNNKKAGGGISLKLGSYRLRSAAIDYNLVKNCWSFSMFSNFESKKDFSVRPITGTHPHDDDETQKINVGFNIKKKTADSMFQFSVKHFNYKYDYDSTVTDELDDQGKYKNYFYGLGYERKWNNKLKTKVNISKATVDREIYGVDNNSDYFYLYKGESNKLDLTGELESKRNHLSFGADALEESVSALDSILPQVKKRSQFSVFVNNDFNLGKTILASGVRASKVHSNKAFLNYKLGSRVLLNNITWRTNLTTGFKAPSLYNLYATFGGNNNLKVEKARTLSSSLNYKSKIIGSTNFSIFKSQYQNYIDYDLATSTYSNTSRALIKGYDLSWQKSWPYLFKTTVSYTYLNTKNRETTKYLKLRPKNSINAKIHYYLSDNLSLGAAYRYIGERDDTSRIRPSYDLFDAIVNYKNITVSVNNVFNKDYQEVSGYQTYGRNFTVGYKYSL